MRSAAQLNKHTKRPQPETRRALKQRRPKAAIRKKKKKKRQLKTKWRRGQHQFDLTLKLHVNCGSATPTYKHTGARTHTHTHTGRHPHIDTNKQLSMWRAHVAPPAEMSKKKQKKNEAKRKKKKTKRKKENANKFQRKLNFGLLAFLLCALNAESGMEAARYGQKSNKARRSREENKYIVGKKRGLDVQIPCKAKKQRKKHSNLN